LGHQNDQDLPTKIESLSQIVNIWCAGHTSYVKDFSGKVLVFGSNSFGQMGLSRFRDIVCSPLEHPVLSEAHTILPFGESLFCVNHNGTVSSCGRNR
jgi:alpha-tubulin suppressor-like RCC1 family protein